MPLIRKKRSYVFTLLILAAPAVAQTPQVDPLPDPRLPAPKQTVPEQIYPCNPGDYEPPESAELPNTLIDCGEVIIPPRGIDPEITAPAPEPHPGTTPIIPPQAIDPQ